MSERAAKLRKLNKLRRKVPHVSGTALSAIIEEIVEMGLPELYNRNHVRESTEQGIEADTRYGKILQMIHVIGKAGLLIPIMVAHPIDFLSLACANVGSFSSYMLRCLETFPSTPESPWELVMYADEVVPGDPLTAQNLRKAWVVYWSFLQLGLDALMLEYAWFTLTCCRSDVISGVEAGMSQVFKEVLKPFFLQKVQLTCPSVALPYTSRMAK